MPDTASTSSATGPLLWLLPLLQACDSALPTGAFAHSFGLETYLDRGTVSDEEGFALWLDQFLTHQLTTADGLAVRLAAELAEDDLAGLCRLDALLHAQALPAQVRQAGVTMGRRLLEIGTQAIPGPRLRAYAELVDDGRCHGHQAIAFALLGADHGAPVDALVRAYLFSTATALTQNAVRGIPIGQNAGQRVLAGARLVVEKAAERIAGLGLEDLGAVPPGLDIAQMQHEVQRARMFMS